jgi:peptidyl-prolyl cis-trans isomerase SurA
MQLIYIFHMNMTPIMDHRLRQVSLGCKRRVRCRMDLTGCARTVCMAALWLLMTLAGFGKSGALGADKAKDLPQDQVVAKVNGMPIYASDLETMVKAQERMLLAQFADDPARLKKELADVRRNALNELIDFQLLEDEFFRLGGVINQEDIDNDERQVTKLSFKGDRKALMEEINAMGMSFEKYRELRERMIIVSAVRARITNNMEVTDAMVREHYDKNLQRWRATEAVKFHTLTILSKTANARSQAEILRTRMVNGGDFAEMARENSADSRADDGGEWPWTRLSDINDTVARVMAKMKKGELSPVLEEPGTFLILRVDDIRETEPRPFESVKEEVKISLMEELAKERIEKRLSQLREAADIKKVGPV